MFGYLCHNDLLSLSQGADLIIALTHMRMPNDEQLLRSDADIDIILGGHDHHYEMREVSLHIFFLIFRFNWEFDLGNICAEASNSLRVNGASFSLRHLVMRLFCIFKEEFCFSRY